MGAEWRGSLLSVGERQIAFIKSATLGSAATRRRNLFGGAKLT
jgi:hypothetical protein